MIGYSKNWFERANVILSHSEWWVRCLQIVYLRSWSKTTGLYFCLLIKGREFFKYRLFVSRYLFFILILHIWPFNLLNESCIWSLDQTLKSFYMTLSYKLVFGFYTSPESTQMFILILLTQFFIQGLSWIHFRFFIFFHIIQTLWLSSNQRMLNYPWKQCNWVYEAYGKIYFTNVLSFYFTSYNYVINMVTHWGKVLYKCIDKCYLIYLD